MMQDTEKTDTQTAQIRKAVQLQGQNAQECEWRLQRILALQNEAENLRREVATLDTDIQIHREAMIAAVKGWLRDVMSEEELAENFTIGPNGLIIFEEGSGNGSEQSG